MLDQGGLGPQPFDNSFAQSSLQLDLEQASCFLTLLGKDPKLSWIRCLKPWLAAPSTGSDRQQLKLEPGANAYLITGNGDPANGRTVKDSDIKSCPALFIEWDNKPVEWQISAWKEFGLPEPSIQVSTGGKSIHCYWVLDEPMAPEPWRALIKRLIAHTGADTNNCNPSRLMRLPGSIYYEKTTGKETGIAEIIHSSDRRYCASEIEACLPPVLAKAAPSTRQLAALPNRQSSDGWPPRTVAEIEAAAQYIPRRVGDEGTYDSDRNAICGCSAAFAEAGAADPNGMALALLGHLWPTEAQARQVLSTATTRNAASFWRIAGDNGFPLSRKSPKAKPSSEPAAGTAKPKAKAKAKKLKQLSHTNAIKCFNRCVYIQCKNERNSFRRRVRLLKAAKDLGLASYINRVEIAAKVLEAKQQAGDGGFKALTAADRKAMQKPVIHWLLPGLLPANDLTILGGRPKVGKTRLAVAIAAAVLTGEPLFDLPPPAKAVPVVLVTDDQSDGDTASMLEAVDLWDHQNLIWSRNFRISETDLDALLATIKANPGALVIIDSLRSISRSMQKGENDPEIGAVLYDLKQAVMDAGGTLLLIHHCNKAVDLVGVEALSGHNAIAGAANTVLTMHYLQGENNQPNKSIPERQLFREARSGDGFDLVITRDGNSFRSLGSMEEIKEQAEEQKQRSKLSNLQRELMYLLPSEEWLTRRQICELLEIEWNDRGRDKAGQQVARALRHLVKLGQVETVRVGTESTYRSLDRMGTEFDETVMTVMTTSHANGSAVITSDTSFDDSDDSSGSNGSAPAPASLTQVATDLSSLSSPSSNKARQPEPQPQQAVITVITESVGFDRNDKNGNPIPPIPNKTDQPNTLLSLLDTTDTTVFAIGDFVAVKIADSWEEGFTVTDAVSTGIGTRYIVERDDRRLNVAATELCRPAA